MFHNIDCILDCNVFLNKKCCSLWVLISLIREIMIYLFTVYIIQYLCIGKNICVAILPVPPTGKSSWTLASVRTWSHVHFILLRVHLQISNSTGLSERLKLNANAVLTILDLIVMSHHTSLSTLMVTIALHVITDCLICIDYLYIFKLNHSSVHL